MRFSAPIKPLATAAFCALALAACSSTNGSEDDPDPVVDSAPGTLLKSDIDRDLDPAIDAATFDEFSADNRDFAFSMLRELREAEAENNVFLSPYSISTALGMTYAGARENTKVEMSEALHFFLDDDELHSAFNKLDLELATRSDFEPDEDEDVAFDLDIVNQTWGHYDFPFEDAYLDLLAEHYGAGLYSVDFFNDFEEIREGINKWVEQKTQDRIQDLLPERSVTDRTRFILVNAIYFYGSWENPFEDSRTQTRDFHLLDGSTTDVEMMSQSDVSFPYYEGSDTMAVSLPYVGDDVSMIALMPTDETADFATWEQEIGREAFDEAVAGLSNREMTLNFPKFEDEGEFNLVGTFEDLGMIDAFIDGTADFTGISTPSLHISGIFHKSFISVDEEGTEAAAATAVVMGIESAPADPLVVTVDRPFLYAIYDHPTDTILFLGRMVDPS